MPIPSPDSNKQRFSIEAFTFIGGHEFVYMHCQVRVCNATDPTSRCARGCLTHRGKRSLGATDFKDEQFNLAEGPIMGKEEKDEQLGKTSEDSIAKIHKVDFQGELRNTLDFNSQKHFLTCQSSGTDSLPTRLQVVSGFGERQLSKNYAHANSNVIFGACVVCPPGFARACLFLSHVSLSPILKTTRSLFVDRPQSKLHGATL